MKDKGKGILSLLLIFLAIAVVAVLAIFGIGKDKVGSARDIKLGLDLAGGVSITYQTVKENPSKEEMDDTIYKMQMRADEESTESAVYQEGNNRINVDIPDVTDANEVLERLGKAGTIYFIYGKSEKGTANIKYNSTLGGYELTRTMEEIIADGDVVVDGTDITNSEAVYYKDDLGAIQYMVKLTLNDAGKAKFAKGSTYATQFYNTDDISGSIAIVYDNKVVSAPRVKTAITDGVATIDGQADMKEAQDLASVIRIGALPLELTQLRSTVVGAKLGTEVINTSVLAGAIGFIIVLLFMIGWYRIPGLAASIALTLYVGLIIVSTAIFNITLTLPGIAGIILSIGMAVDANVVIFQRIREEIGTGKTVRSSIKVGFHKALSAIIDGNVCTLIASIVLYVLGSGTVKGFAVTLAVGLIISMFTALFVTKYIVNAFYTIGFDQEKYYGTQKPKEKYFDYVGSTGKFIIVAILLVAIGVGGMIVNKTQIGESLAYGLDFKGGTSTQITLPDTVTGDITKELEDLVTSEVGVIGEIVSVKDSNSYIIKTKELSRTESDTLNKSLIAKYNIDPQLITSDSISGTVSGEMKTKAIWAVVISTIAMLIYIWIRFKDLGFASSAVIALLHDAFMVIAVYAVLRLTVSNTLIANLLTILGYSINSTVIIFDRIRDNIKDRLKKESLREIVNTSIGQTISRTINTNLTSLIMVTVLAFIGVESIKEFAIPLIGGIAAGTFSSVCITGTIWYFYELKVRKQK
jgi:SecD/SecF fusion protein